MRWPHHRPPPRARPAAVGVSSYAEETGLGRFITRYDRTDLPNPDQAQVVGGHYLGISIDQLFAGRQIKRSILLRDPASHFVSYYNYRMARYISEGLQPYSLEVAYGATQRNFITHYILKYFLELSLGRGSPVCPTTRSTRSPTPFSRPSGSSATISFATTSSPA